MRKIILYSLLFILIHGANACSFKFVPFAADWGHSFFLNSDPFFQDGNNIGLLYYQRSFQRSFTVYNANVPTTYNTRENISTQSKFKNLYSSGKMKFDISISTTDIRFEGISDDGINPMHSWTKNEVTFTGKVLLMKKQKHKRISYLFFDFGIQTALFSSNGIDNNIGWMDLYMYQINPRQMPTDKTNNLSLGLSSMIDFNKFQIYSTGTVCNYIQPYNGFGYGSEMNLSTMISYKAVNKDLTKIQINGGFYFEHGESDQFYQSGLCLIYLPCGRAEGNDLFLSSGITLQYGKISCFAKYYQPIWQDSFSEHQLFNQSILVTGASFSF